MKYALINGILLDGTETMQPRPGLTVLVNGDRIEAIVPAGTEGSDYERIDLAGGYVMPGLINLHVHLPASGRPTVKVRKIAEDKPNLIKLMITGGVLDAKSKGEPGELKMPPEVVKAACDQAHALGLPVAAHVESPQGVRVALEGGVDTIEHGAAPDEEILHLFKERKACHIATISPALPYAMFDRSVTGASETEQYNGKLVMDGIIDCAKACLKNGIPVGLGTDTGCPYITHYDMWREVYYFHKFCGVTNAFALHTATLGNARLVGLGAETGSLEPGKCADLVVTGGNPLEDLKALRHMDLVMARGNLIRAPKVKKIEKAERELDKFL